MKKSRRQIIIKLGAKEVQSVGNQTSWREDAGMRNMSQRGWVPRPPVEQPRRAGKKRCYGHKSGGSICCSSVSPTPSHSKTFSNPFEPVQIKWEVYFSKGLSRSSLLCRRYDSACICICVCRVVHGYTTKWISKIQIYKFIIFFNSLNPVKSLSEKLNTKYFYLKR